MVCSSDQLLTQPWQLWPGARTTQPLQVWETFCPGEPRRGRRAQHGICTSHLSGWGCSWAGSALNVSSKAWVGGDVFAVAAPSSWDSPSLHTAMAVPLPSWGGTFPHDDTVLWPCSQKSLNLWLFTRSSRHRAAERKGERCCDIFQRHQGGWTGEGGQTGPFSSICCATGHKAPQILFCRGK